MFRISCRPIYLNFKHIQLYENMPTISHKFLRENIRNTLSSESDCFHYLLHRNMILLGNIDVIIMPKDTLESKMHRIAPFKNVFQPPNP